MKLVNRDLLIWLNSIGITRDITYRKMKEYFGDINEIWTASEKSIKYALNNASIVESLLKNRNVDYYESIKRNIKEHGISAITILDSDFPLKLKQIYDPPRVIYVKGKCKFDIPSIAIIGARKATPYGKWAAYHFASELSKWNVSIISGLALGIDAESHKAALDANNHTIAVLGCGVEKCYPAYNTKIYDRIIEVGCVISEYYIGTQPLKYHFPARNRIISALSDGIVVVEAALKSGALITADFALEHGKEIYVVPGNINSANSVGTNKLICDGAKILLNVNDIVEDLKLKFNIKNEDAKAKESVQLSEEEQKIYDIIKSEQIHIDFLSYKSGYAINKLSPILTILELKEFIMQLPGKIFTINIS
ncbi:MAG: DNA-protecting protein DprA [Alkaliphilus sp.]|nr:DNA-processing protein DprA [Alkaliphilus transvaalensis]PHS35235.1 MAG: DNA-protecting protein DprA [Alkaliphilus sp.]